MRLRPGGSTWLQITPCVLLLALMQPLLWAEPFSLADLSVSRSRQFYVYAPEREWRGGVALVADDTKEWLLQKLRIRDDWKHPIIIHITRESASRPGADPATLRVFETEIGPKVQLDLIAGPTRSGVSIQREVLRAVLTEMALRDSKTQRIASEQVQPPEWLITGFHALRQSEEEGLGASFYEALLAAGNLPSFEDFIRSEPQGMDSTSLKLHQAAAAALVQAILDMPDGRDGLLAFLKNRNPSDDLAHLRENIAAISPETGGLERWWSLAIAKLASQQQHEARRVETTAAQFDELLYFEIKDDNGQQTLVALEDFRKLDKNPALPLAKAALTARVRIFATTANPLFVPVIEAYLTAIQFVGKEKPATVQKRLAQAAQLRSQVEQLGTDITDHMNWVEATRPGGRSGDFEDYFRAVKALEQPVPERRADSISRYLDSMEMELE